MKPNKITLEVDATVPSNYRTVERLINCHKRKEVYSALEFDLASYDVTKLKEKPNNVYTFELTLAK